MPINDFIQFHFGWLNAWIPSFALVLIQLLYMILYREGGKRAVDTSWYTSKDKRYATLSFVFQGTLLLVSLFVPLRIGTPGSGKSFAVVNNYIKQQIEKGYSMYICSDLSSVHNKNNQPYT